MTDDRLLSERLTFNKDHERPVHAMQCFVFRGVCRFAGLVAALVEVKGKCKAVPLQAWSGPECSRKLRFPDYMTTAQDGGKVVSLTPLPPGNAPGTHLC